MKEGKKGLIWLFAAVMLLFSLTTAAWAVMRKELDFRLEDTRMSLDTSRGRERKQQYEYDEAAEALPRTRTELAEVQPEADAAAERVKALKDRRKALREEKKRLEAEAADGKTADAPGEEASAP